jgi:hypothetical protein
MDGSFIDFSCETTHKIFKLEHTSVIDSLIIGMTFELNWFDETIKDRENDKWPPLEICPEC